MRLAGGAWCIAALILTNFYSSVLTSLITLSLPVPIVNSVEELANNDNVDLVIAKNWGASLLISVRDLLYPLFPMIVHWRFLLLKVETLIDSKTLLRVKS